ncbi:hypothetical protein D3C72_1896800 [compost metagenome]
MKGVVFQISTISTACMAVSAVAVQATFWLNRPRRRPRSFRMPNWSFSIQLHILAETMVGIAQGMRMAARTMLRPRNSALSTSATIMPRMASKNTDVAAKRRVFHTAFHQAGSTSKPR